MFDHKNEQITCIIKGYIQKTFLVASQKLNVVNAVSTHLQWPGGGEYGSGSGEGQSLRNPSAAYAAWYVCCKSRKRSTQSHHTTAAVLTY